MCTAGVQAVRKPRRGWGDRYRAGMRYSTLGRSVAAGLWVFQVLAYIFIAVYAFAGWTFAGELITLKTVVLFFLAMALLQRLAAYIPGPSRYRSRPNRLLLASL
jgi:hypothetical protein